MTAATAPVIPQMAPNVVDAKSLRAGYNALYIVYVRQDARIKELTPENEKLRETVGGLTKDVTSHKNEIDKLRKRLETEQIDFTKMREERDALFEHSENEETLKLRIKRMQQT